jgi:hypothetical protein
MSIFNMMKPPLSMHNDDATFKFFFICCDQMRHENYVE